MLLYASFIDDSQLTSLLLSAWQETGLYVDARVGFSTTKTRRLSGDSFPSSSLRRGGGVMIG